MSARIKLDPQRFRHVLTAMYGLKSVVQRSGLPSSLVHLIKVRVSLINGCGFCIDMHTKDARAEGETEQRLYLLGAWREATVYSERERAALAWADAVTVLDDQRVDEAVYEKARAAFSEDELVALTLAIVEINGWNRFAISFQYEAGGYVPGQFASVAV